MQMTEHCSYAAGCVQYLCSYVKCAFLISFPMREFSGGGHKFVSASNWEWLQIMWSSASLKKSRRFFRKSYIYPVSS
jgi:hypothetical protein